jgi:hypothetical protein
VELVREFVAGPAGALPQWIAPLNHEAVDHAVEDDAVVERGLLLLARRGIRPLPSAFGEADEILDGARRFVREQADGEPSLAGIEMGIGAWLHS